MMFYNKGHIGWKNSAPEKTLGSTDPRDQDSKGLDYAPPVAQWTAGCRWEHELIRLT